MLPLGREEEISKGGVVEAGWIVMLRAMETEFGGLAESVTWTVMGKVPVAVGVPAMAPVLGFKVRPLGSVPVAMLQVTAPVPPADCNVAVYGVFRTPSGSAVVLIASCRARKKGEPGATANLPVPSPTKMEMESSSSLATAKSCVPSPLRSPLTIAVGLLPTEIATGFWNVPSQLLISTC